MPPKGEWWGGGAGKGRPGVTERAGGGGGGGGGGRSGGDFFSNMGARRSPPGLGPWCERCTSAGPDWPASHGLQTGVVGNAWLECFASADLPRWQVLHFRLESTACVE